MKKMEEQTVIIPEGKRTSMDNMLCLVDFEELSAEEEREVEEALALAF
ncbi:MAG: hypothetical protein ACPGJV_10285 [Bacteriovoracaceae bacterium]